MGDTSNAPRKNTGLIFLSHSGADTQAAKDLAGLLRQGGVDVWLDVERLVPGNIWMDGLESALKEAKHLIVYIGPSGVRAWVGREVRFALDRSTKDQTFRLIPVLGPGADPEALPPFLKQHEWLDIRDGRDPAQELKRLLQSLTGSEPAEVSLLSPNQSPFRGLFAFEEEDALFFYGRDEETSELVEKLALDRFLAVVGDSGSGKSSLVRAGLIPALHGGRLALATGEASSWRICIARPGDHPFSELAEALAQLDPRLSAAESTAFVAEAKRQMTTGSDSLRNAIAGLRIPRATHILVVVDQFEELFTTGVGKDEQLRYINTLLAAVPTGADNRVHVVITLRADFYSQCWAHPDFPKRIAANQFAVQRMDREQLREAIEKPLVLAGVRIEPGLVDALLNEVGDEPGNLPLLEHALEQLWERRAAGVITNAAYENIGRLKGALRNYADQAYKTLGNEEKRAIARKMLVRLTQLGEGSPDTRRRAAKSELLAATGGRPEAEQVLNKLVSARLITVGMEHQTRRDVVEIAHEALIREWPLLRGWVSEDRQDLRVERAILQAAEEWESFGKDLGALLKGARLAQAEEWSARHARELPDSASEFLQTSIVSRDEEVQKERERWQQAVAESRQLAEQARQKLDRNPALSLALAIRAVQCFRTEQAEVELNAALSVPQPRVILHHTGCVATAEFSPDGKRVVTASYDHTARVWDAESGRELATLTGHQSIVRSAVFSPDGKRVVTGSLDKTARVWDAESGRELAALTTGHRGVVFTAAFSPDGKRVVIASYDKTAQVWDAESGRELATLTGHQGWVLTAAFSPDGKRVVTASEDQTARVWDVESGRELATLTGHQGIVRSAVFSRDSKRVVTASADQTARVWDAESGRALSTLTGHEGIVRTAAFSPDGKQVVTAGEDQTARVWDAESGRELATLTGHQEVVYTAVFSRDGKQVVTASYDQTARVWDAESGRELATLAGHQDLVYTAAFSPDGKQVVTASEDQTARVWDAERGRALATLAGHQGKVYSAAFSPDGKRVVTASEDQRARVWDAESGRELATLTGHQGVVTAAAFSPDCKRVVTTSYDRTARVWDAESGQALATLTHQGEVYTAAFSPDGKQVVTASEDQRARVWDAESGRALATLTGHRGVVTTAAFSPDGERVVTASYDHTARVWDAESGRKLATLTGHKGWVLTAAFSPDGKQVVTASLDRTAQVWDAEGGRALSTLTGHQGKVYSAAFSPDGKRLATASGDKTVRVWDAEGGRALSTLTGHQGKVYSAAFSPDGKRLATASGDKTARVWDAEGGRELATLTGHQGKVYRTAFSPDGKRVVTASEDHTALVYIVDLDDLLSWVQRQLLIENK